MTVDGEVRDLVPEPRDPSVRISQPSRTHGESRSFRALVRRHKWKIAILGVFILFLLLGILLLAFLLALPACPGDVRDDVTAATMTSLRYVTYVRGRGNVVLAAPHGGDRAVEAPRRHDGRWTGGRCDWRWDTKGPYDHDKCYSSVTQDTYTRPITRLLADKLRTKTPVQPHLILMDVHRVYVDANRPKYMGTASHPLAEQIWDEYHNSIRHARSLIKGPGLFLEIHGHTHNHNITELGYRVMPHDLNNMNFSINDTSIKNLATRVRVGTGLGDLMWGDTSLGSLLEDQGYQAMPSRGIKTPGSRRYFRGGYDTEQYGSQLGGEIDGIQVEIPLQLRNKDKAEQVSEALAEAIAQFWRIYYKV